MVISPHKVSFGPSSVDISDTVEVSLLAFSLDSGLSTVNICNVDLIPDELRLRRLDDLIGL